MADIYLLRHGHYQNYRNIIPFRLPGFSLNNDGIKEAELASKYLVDKKISYIFSSPILRCRQTAMIVAKKLHLKFKISTLITETISPYQGMSLAKYSFKEMPTFIQTYHQKNQGETYQQIYTRGI